MGRASGNTPFRHGPTLVRVTQARGGSSEGSAIVVAGVRFQVMPPREPATRVDGGADEIPRDIIAEPAPGLPGDIRVDKGVAFKDIPASGQR